MSARGTSSRPDMKPIDHTESTRAARGNSAAPGLVIALWAVPRSVSTAFERMMTARGDFTVFNEPFSACYYFGPNRVSDRFPPETPSSDHDPDRILETFQESAADSAVFFRDMAYHVRDIISKEFLAQFTNTLLIRNPDLAIPSLYKRMPDFTLEETGYESLLALAELATDVAGTPPFAMDGEQLRRDPRTTVRAFCDATDIPFREDALEWQPQEEEHWNRWQEWYRDAANSSGFKRPARPPDPEVLAIPRVAEAIEHCRPLYEELKTYCADPQESPK